MSGGVCYSFKDTGSCRFGDSCRFGHDGGSGAGGADGEDFQTVTRNRREQRGGATASRYNDSSSYRREGGDYGSYGGRSYGGQRDTQPCHSWSDNGSCEYGERCRFSHGTEATRGSGGASAGGVRGGFGGINSRYNNNTRAAGPCYEFQEKGSCQYGDRCRFSHGAAGESRERSSGGNSAPCYSFQSSGSCRFGDSCRFSHNTDDKKIGAVDSTATTSRTGSDGQPENPQSDPSTAAASKQPQADNIKSPQAGAIKSPAGPTATASA